MERTDVVRIRRQVQIIPPDFEELLTITFRSAADAKDGTRRLTADFAAHGEPKNRNEIKTALARTGIKQKPIDAFLTPVEYVASGGKRCPLCGGSDSVEKLSSVHTSEITRWPAECEDCGATWNELIELTGYTDLCLPAKQPTTS